MFSRMFVCLFDRLFYSDIFDECRLRVLSFINYLFCYSRRLFYLGNFASFLTFSFDNSAGQGIKWISTYILFFLANHGGVSRSFFLLINRASKCLRRVKRIITSVTSNYIEYKSNRK